MALKQLLGHVLDFCYPGICAHCRAGCASSAFLCDECASKLDALANAPACERCAMPLATDGAPCPYCKGKGLTPFDRIVRLGVFQEPLKDCIHAMKYHDRWGLAEALADCIAAHPRVQQLIDQDAVLVPVPLHYLRRMRRGYNQAELIARRLRKNFRCQLELPVRRIRNTATQTNIHAQAERHENVRGAFALRSSAACIAGKHVVLVDDVMTSGATLRTVGRTLLAAKPSRISAVVLAIADPKGRGFEVI